MSTEDLVALFEKVSLDPKTAKNAAKNPKFSATLTAVIGEAGCEAGCDRQFGNLLYTVAAKYPPNALVHRPHLLGMVMRGELKSNAQLEGCFAYLKGVGAEAVDDTALKKAGGVGVSVTQADIEAAIGSLLASEAAALAERRYLAVPPLLVKLRGVGDMKWADQKALKLTWDAKVLETLGPKTEADMAAGKSGKGKKNKKEKKEAAAKGASAAEEEKPSDPYAFFPKPGENNGVHTTVNFSDGRVMRIANSSEELARHLAVTGGRTRTRFPPEPNGYLHIGHAKAMFVDFGLAEHEKGDCFLRYDDTNPNAEKTEYIEHIVEIVSWMGWKPWKVTYSSDYFAELHALAVKLIECGCAYVCHQTAAEISACRAEKRDSPWRDRPVSESLALFEKMRLGLFDEGAATLRMRMDMRNENFNMYDLIAYRIKFAEHPHAGDAWCIYPSYDFTHCIVDSLEHITHSLCTLEFEPRRASYYWLLEVLGLYKPHVWEYSRLNVTNNVLSKRKLNKLVTDGYVGGWDDPRLLTLAGLRRRGATKAAINNFCADLGITRNENDIPVHRLEHHIRADLEATAPRAMGVLRPLRLVVGNFPAGKVETFHAKRFPGRTDETYEVPMTREVFIESSDFRTEDAKGYYGLAPGKTVMLRYAFAVRCVSFDADAKTGEPSVVHCERVEVAKPPKGIVHWVAAGSGAAAPLRAEARLYDVLFRSENVAECEDWLADINPDSLRVESGAVLTPALASAKPGDTFQLERVGYFCIDEDSEPGRLVLNRTCTLKESVLTKGIKKGK